MIIRHTNMKPVLAPAPNSASPPPGSTSLPRVAAGAMAPQATKPKGDIIYGARAIARYLFDDDGNSARRRVYTLWAHYHARGERAGLFKLKGALCLSKSQWQAFHGLQ